MKKNKKFITLFVCFFAAYLLPELLFPDAMLYLAGGLVANSLQGILQAFIENSQDSLVLILWALILATFTFLLFIVRNKGLKYIFIALLFILLYFVDFGLFNFISYDPSIPKRIILDTPFKSATFSFLQIISKSLILSLIVYLSLKEQCKTNIQ